MYRYCKILISGVSILIEETYQACTKKIKDMYLVFFELKFKGHIFVLLKYPTMFSILNGKIIICILIKWRRKNMLVFLNELIRIFFCIFEFK